MKTMFMDGKEYTIVPVSSNSAPAKTGAEGTKIMVIDGNKCMLVPVSVQKAPAKAVASTAPVVPPVKPVQPATRKPTSPLEWVLVVIAIIAVIWFLIWAVGRLVNNMNNNNVGNAITNTNPVLPGTVSEETALDLGSIGAYHAVYDTIENKWTLGIWETSMTRVGKGLSEFKLRATSVSFTMPSDGEINNSAGHIAINNTEWTLGNPARDSSGNALVKKGDVVTIWTDGPNESAGFQIWFNK